MLPRPPRPPLQTVSRWPGSVRSPSRDGVSPSEDFVDHRAGRNVDDQVFAGTPVHFLFGAGAAVIGHEAFLVTEVERVERGLDFKDDIAALAAVAAIGPTARDVFLPAEMHDAIAALAGFYVDFYLIDEHDSIVTKKTYGLPKGITLIYQACD